MEFGGHIWQFIVGHPRLLVTSFYFPSSHPFSYHPVSSTSSVYVVAIHSLAKIHKLMQHGSENIMGWHYIRRVQPNVIRLGCKLSPRPDRKCLEKVIFLVGIGNGESTATHGYISSITWTNGRNCVNRKSALICIFCKPINWPYEPVHV